MILPDTSKEYFLIVNHQELKEKAFKLGYDNVILVNDDGIDDETIQEIKAADKGVAMILFPCTSTFGGKTLGKLKRAGIRCMGTIGC